MTTNTYGVSRANSAMGMRLCLLLGGSLVRIIKLATRSRPELSAALIRTPFAKLPGSWKR